MYLLQDEIVLFIMNKCSWDWWGRDMDGAGGAGEATTTSEAGSSSSGGQRLMGGGSRFGGGVHPRWAGMRDHDSSDAMRAMCESGASTCAELSELSGADLLSWPWLIWPGLISADHIG